MKQMSLFFATLLFLVLSFTNSQKAIAYQDDYISMQTFYDELSTYGYWMEDPDYGYVWSPDAGRNFRPYFTNGHWAMTQYGNTWISDYDWGWATFHYGRWTYDQYYGWLWIPGNEWAPAWVTWRSGGGYYGWAPMGPGSDNYYGYDNDYYAPNFWWVFIPNYSIYSSNYYAYWRGPRYNFRMMYRTNVIRNSYNNHYACGPNRREVEHYTGRNVIVFNLNNEHGKGRPRTTTNSIGMYRPQVNNTPRNGFNCNKEMPKNVRQLAQPIQKEDVAGMRRNESMINTQNHDINNRKEYEDRVPDERPVFQRENRNYYEPIPKKDIRNSRFDNNSIQKEEQPIVQERSDYVAQNQQRNNLPAPQNTIPLNVRPRVEWRRPEPQQQESPKQVERQRNQENNFEKKETPKQELQIHENSQTNPQLQRNIERGIRR